MLHVLISRAISVGQLPISCWAQAPGALGEPTWHSVDPSSRSLKCLRRRKSITELEGSSCPIPCIDAGCPVPKLSQRSACPASSGKPPGVEIPQQGAGDQSRFADLSPLQSWGFHFFPVFDLKTAAFPPHAYIHCSVFCEIYKPWQWELPLLLLAIRHTYYTGNNLSLA